MMHFEEYTITYVSILDNDELPKYNHEETQDKPKLETLYTIFDM